MKNIQIYFAILFLLVSCQSSKDKEEPIISANESYQKGIELFKSNEFKEAADSFGKVYFQHPGSKITPYAELMEAYSLFKAKMYQDSIDVIDNFISIHPMNEDIEYAFYLKALSYYNQISDVHHDQNMTMMALNSFEELIKRFPNSRYIKDVSGKLNLINDHLAGSEMEIGRYYQKLLNPVGAINRFQTVISKYQTTTHTPEALYRLVESFMLLGLKDEAEKYGAVLAYNYPASLWSDHARNLLVLKRD